MNHLSPPVTASGAPPLLPAAARWTPLFALLAGASNVLAFAPFHFWPLQIITLSWLFRQVARHTTGPGAWRRCALIGWLYGFAWAACGVHWLVISMHDYGGMAAWLAILALALLAAYLGLFAAFCSAAASWLKQRWQASETTLLLLLLPALWTLTEWVRGWLLTGFPWLSSGYAHNIGPLAGFAPVLGVYGVAWIAALVAACLTLLSLNRRLRIWPAGLALLLGSIGLTLQTHNWTSPIGTPISVRLLQGNIAQEMKFSNATLLASLMMYDTMIRSAPADLIATPETALPLLPQQLPANYLTHLLDFAQSSGSHLALGMPLSDGPQHYANSVLAFSPAPVSAVAAAVTPVVTPYRYDKHHLVPFGEFIPFGFRWFVDMMRIPLGDLTRGQPLQMPFAVKQQWLLPNICYEDLFGEEIAAQLSDAYYRGRPQASILLNLSNIAWFGASIALPQHLQISQMRALETGRPMLRATNTGTTAVIDPKGRLLAALPTHTQGMLTASVQGYQGQTPYILFGNKLVLSLTLAALVLAYWLARRKR